MTLQPQDVMDYVLRMRLVIEAKERLIAELDDFGVLDRADPVDAVEGVAVMRRFVAEMKPKVQAKWNDLFAHQEAGTLEQRLAFLCSDPASVEAITGDRRNAEREILHLQQRRHILENWGMELPLPDERWL